MTAYTVEQKIPQRLAWYWTEPDASIRWEVTVVARRRSDEEPEVYVIPRRGRGGAWVTESNIDWIT